MDGLPPDFEKEFKRLVHESRGLLDVIKSIKTNVTETVKSDPLYRMTIKRLKYNGIRLASFAECVRFFFSEEKRDALLTECGCSWDATRRNVNLH